MITFLTGEVVSVTEKQLILDVNHVGFRLSISARDARKMPDPGEEITIFTYMSVREDAITLFGFLEEEDLEIYRRLITVGGIGPKGGLGILSVMDADEIRFAVLAEDAKSIAKAPGIGLKTAQKVILELKDKMDLNDVISKRMEKGGPAESSALDAQRAEAIDMMTALGYTASEALRAVRGAHLTEGMSADEILRAALRDSV